MFRRIAHVLLISLLGFKGFSQSVFFNSNNDLLWNFSDSLFKYDYNSNILLHDYHHSFIYHKIKQYKNIGAINEVYSVRDNFFNSGYDALGDYNLKSDVFSHHILSTYFSQLKYLTGTRKEQIISIEHHQKLLKVLNAGIVYRGIASPGYYKQQFNNFKNFATYLKYASANRRYESTVYYFSNKLIGEDNGGIIADSLLKVYKGQERSILVNLNNAEHRIRNKGFCLNQFYIFKNPASNDSIQHDSIPKQFVGIEHTAEFSKQSFVYNESAIDPDYYLNNYLSESVTEDSLAFKKLSNQINFSFYNIPLFGNRNNVLLGFKAGAELNSYKSQQYIYDTTFTNNSAQVVFNLGTHNKWNLNTSFKKSFEQSLQSCFISESRLSYRINNLISHIGILYRKQEVPPEYISENYYSNHFIWRNDFNNKKESVYKVFANFFKDQLSLNFYRYSIKGYVFYDELFKYPHQQNNEVTINKGELKINYRLGNWHLLSENIFNFSSTSSIIKSPLIDLSNSIYYEKFFFKKALLAAIGAHCYYQSAYYANGFNPATGQFYLQHRVKVGDYPYVNIFLDMTIKTAKIFLMLEHVNAGIGERNYFYMPHYPTPPRTLKFGLSWTFKD